eukprot:9403927-Ditylum_brightwellii.AAC.1
MLQDGTMHKDVDYASQVGTTTCPKFRLVFGKSYTQLQVNTLKPASLLNCPQGKTILPMSYHS